MDKKTKNIERKGELRLRMLREVLRGKVCDSPWTNYLFIAAEMGFGLS